MAGINRLGKAPPKPGTLRPPDPNKFRSINFYSENTEQDADYMRMVQDIEDSQQQQGWLFGRGAFDKGDLLYLRDEEEKRRHVELELRDTEKTVYAAMRARLDNVGDAADVVKIARKKSSGAARPVSKAGAAAIALTSKTLKRRRDDDTPAAVNNNSNSNNDGAAADGTDGDDVNDDSDGKRTRAESSMPPQHTAADEAVADRDGGTGTAALAGLLGDYGSDDDNGDDDDDDRSKAQPQPQSNDVKGSSGASKLPCALHLLGDAPPSAAAAVRADHSTAAVAPHSPADHGDSGSQSDDASSASDD